MSADSDKVHELYRYNNHYNVVVLESYPVVKTTPCGYWIRDYSRDKNKRFVLASGRKRFAYETKELAKESFIIRKNRQLQYFKAGIENVKLALEAIEAGKTENSSIYYTFE